jgi:hypothetical protein
MRIRVTLRGLTARLQMVPAALATSLLLAGQASAQSCLIFPAKLSDGLIEAFKNRPAEVLERHPMGGPVMSVEIMRRAGSDISTLLAVLQVARDGSAAQRVAIGIGLARTTAVCSRTQPEAEQMIKQAVTEAGISELTAAFAAGLSPLEQAMAPVGLGSQAPTPLSGKRGTDGGSSAPALTGGGGASTNTGSTQFLTFSVRGSAISVRQGGIPSMSLRFTTDAPDEGNTPPGEGPTRPPSNDKGDPPFGDKGVKSTYGSTVSPTRR